MIPRILVVLLLVFAIAGDCSAQAKPGGVARQIAMGGAAFSTPGANGLVFNPFIFEDPSWTLVNPAYAGLYRDYLWLNLAGGSVLGANGGENGYGNQFGGFGIGLAGGLTLGATLSYDPSYSNRLLMGTGALIPAYVTSLGYIRSNPVLGANPAGTVGRVEVLEVLAAFRIPSLTFGGAFSYGWTNKDMSVDPTVAGQLSEAEYGASFFGVRLGAIADLGGGNAVEGSAALRFDSAIDSYTINGTAAGQGKSEYTASVTEMQFTVRARFSISQKVKIVPYGVFRTISGEPKEESILGGQTASTVSYERSISTFAFGAGIEYTSKNLFFAAGLSIAGDKTTDETSRTLPTAQSASLATGTSAFPVINLGAEFPLASWLDGRVGYYRSFSSTTYKNENTPGGGTTTTIEGSLFAGSSTVGIPGYGPVADNSLLTLGLGVTVDAFALDATVSEEALRRGLGLIGASDNINTFGYLTVSFTFE